MKTLRTARPLTREGWATYYAKRFNKTENPAACHLAMWYLFMALAEADGVYP